MASVDSLTAAKAAGTSAAIVCAGTAEITIGIYVDNNLPFSERVGAIVQISNPEGYADFFRDGRVVVLTESNPVISIRQAGTYQVKKPATEALIGVFSDVGA